MLKPLLTWLSQGFWALQASLQCLIRSLSGQDRRDKRRLMKHLSTLQAEQNLMQQKATENQRLTHLEIRGLTTLKKQAEDERDDLQLQVWELEQQVQELLGYITQTHTDQQQPQTTTLLPPTEAIPTAPLPDLSMLVLGLVGGHPATRRGVIEALTTHYGLKHWVTIPPLHEASIRKHKLKKKLSRCDLIVIIADYMSHPLTHAIYGLQASGSLKGEVVLLNCHGKSGVLRDILYHVNRQNMEK
ncbi:hypothetical protein [Leptolyngbya sp. PCC 6406]|uniref:hypothetical protein n=1 Tax=Leptolyngbya sp. PCC 6406 TaxID=1173264 RepID=UPI0002ABC61B|nr:hypothetical protein [Leptolyngbya sp. PCC 6406]